MKLFKLWTAEDGNASLKENNENNSAGPGVIVKVC